MRKQGSLDGIILLVISFSVINYVVSESVRLRQADTLFFYARKRKLAQINEVPREGIPSGGLFVAGWTFSRMKTL